MSSKTMLKAALDLAARGLPVFPCVNAPKDQKRHKRPLTPHGFKDATIDAGQIQKWWKRTPDALIGIPTGKTSGIVVIDLDVDASKKPPKNGLAMVPDWEKRTPVIARTGRGGAHLYFRDDETIGNSTDKIAYGVDTRGEGGYVIVPPSFGYTWMNGCDLAKLPEYPDDLRPTKRETRERRISNDQAEADPRRMAAAMAVIPNDNVGWEDWNRVAMALWRATGGSDEGFQIFDAWSKKSAKYDPDATSERWDGISHSPPKEIGAGSIFHMAKAINPSWEDDWVEEMGRAVMAASRPKQKPKEPEPAIATPKKAKPLPRIEVVSGEIDRIADEVERALVKAQQPVLIRAGELFEPIYTDYPTAKGGKTRVTILKRITVAKLQYISNKHAAEFVKFDGRTKKIKRIDPPPHVMNMILEKGHGPFPQVTGIINSPTLRPDGSILGGDERHLDAATGLWFDPDPNLKMPPIPEQPTKADAKAALALLCELLVEFPFVDPLDRSVALAAILTAVVRGAFAMAPMFLFAAHDAGTGKSFSVDLISYIVRGRPCPVIAFSPATDEMEKRLGALLLEGIPLISLDNCTTDLEGPALCQMTERPTVKVRVLGKSETPEAEWRGMLFATGNNIGFAGDMTRRGLSCNLDAKEQQPELRKFKFNPIERVSSDRGKYIAAAIAIARAYLVSGANVECPPLGSYGEWSRFVREPLIWIGEPDPVKSMEAARGMDPGRQAASEFIELWEKCLGVEKPYRAQEIIDKANETRPAAVMGNGLPDQEYVWPELHNLLMAEVPMFNNRGIDARALGKWLSRIRGQVYGEWTVQMARQSSSHGNLWALMPRNRREG